MAGHCALVAVDDVSLSMDGTTNSPAPTWVGQSILRREDPPLLIGAGRFIDDLAPVAGLRHAAILRSPHAHAEIVNIDTTAAERLEGVVGVLTGEDVARLSDPIGNLLELDAPYYPCASGRVRYVGEPVAVVVAVDRYVAEDALELIRIEYRSLTPVVDPELAAAPEAPVLHPGLATNIVHSRSFNYGEAEKAFAEAHRVLRLKTHYPRVASNPMETYGVIANFETSPDRYTVWSNFQGPYTLFPLMCAALKVASSRFRLISPPCSGGSFGIKQAVYPYIILMAIASRKFGVAVKWIEDRLEHLAASSCSSDRVVSLEGAFTATGKLMALRVDQLENVGAYLRPPEPAGLYRFHATLGGPYDLGHVCVKNRVVVTNQMPTGLNRGYGGPQYCFPLERLMDQAACALGIDPVQIRLRNLVRKDQFPYKCAAGGVLDSGDYHRAVELALSKLDIGGYRRLQSAARAAGRIVGIGIGCSVEAAGANLAYINLALTPDQRKARWPKSGGSATSTITLDALGGIVVRVDCPPAGQGHQTVLAQVVADELGVHPDDVTVVTELDTLRDSWSISAGNYANRFSTSVVGAASLAARAVAAKLRAIAAPMLGAPENQIALRNGRAYGADDRSFSIRQLAARSHWHTGGLPPTLDAGISETATLTQPSSDVSDEDELKAHITYAFQVDVAAVEIDKETGKIQILKYVSVHDAGTLLNPLLANGQIYGGFAHGLGAALSEKVLYAGDGTLLSATFQDYKCVSAVDMPPFEFDHIESPSPYTIHGSKGLGDGCSMLTPAVIANALDDAIGLSDTAPPFTPSVIWQLLRDPNEVQTTSSTELGQGTQIKGEGRTTVQNASPEAVWQLLFDVDFMRRLLPGCEKLEQVGDDKFKATITISVAGIGGQYDVDMRIEDKVDLQRAKLVCSAVGKLGFGNGVVSMVLAKAPTGTNVAYTYTGSVGGKAAAVGHRMLDGVMRVVIAEFFGKFNDQFEPSGVSRVWRRLTRRLGALLSIFIRR